MKKRFLPINLLFFASLLVFSSCSQVINDSSINDDSISEIVDDSGLQEEKVRHLANEIIKQLPDEIDDDLLLPTIEEEGYILSYEVDKSTIQDGVLIYINAQEGMMVNLIVTVDYYDISCSLNKEIRFKGFHINEGLSKYLSTYLDMLPSLVKQDYILPYLLHDQYDVQIRVDNYAPTHRIVKYTFPSKREEGHYYVTAFDKETGEAMSRAKSFTYESKDVATSIPIVRLTTQNKQAITSKEDYVTGTFSLEEKNENNEYVSTISRLGMKIRGRGNSTWGLPKKPYKIKFDGKTSLFGEKAQKDWVLLANYVDHTLIRDYLAKTLGRTLDGFTFTPSCHFVDVYLNDEYQGNYMLTDQVEVKAGRVEVERNSKEADTGYLVELDMRLYDERWSSKNVDWFEISANDTKNNRSRGMPFDIKYPETDDVYFSSTQLNFIKNYMQSAIDSISRGADWQHYIDIKSAVDFFLIEDLFKNVDVGMASAFMYKNKGGKLCFGPLWDFDLSSLNQGHLDYNLRQYYDWYSSRWDKNNFCYFLMKDNTFKKALKERWLEFYPNLLEDINSLINNIVGVINEAATRNFKKWDIIGKNYDWYTSTEVYNAKTYSAQINLLKGWFKDRIAWMNTEINKF